MAVPVGEQMDPLVLRTAEAILRGLRLIVWPVNEYVHKREHGRSAREQARLLERVPAVDDDREV